MAIPLIAKGVAAFAATEILARLLDDWTGDPEAQVEALLQQIQKESATQAVLASNRPAMVDEAVAKAFEGIRPERTLTQMAMLQRGQMDITPDNKPVLSYVAAQLGVHPADLLRRSSPGRMGDFSALQRSAVPPEMRESPAQMSGGQ